MKIIKAMKKVKKLKGDICNLEERISKNISTFVENEFDEEINELLIERDKMKMELMNLKNRIMKSNIDSNHYILILQMGELKSDIDFLKKLNIKTGIDVDEHSWRKEKDLKYKTQITEKERINMIKTIQEKIDIILETLDSFNAMTDI